MRFRQPRRTQGTELRREEDPEEVEKRQDKERRRVGTRKGGEWRGDRKGEEKSADKERRGVGTRRGEEWRGEEWRQ